MGLARLRMPLVVEGVVEVAEDTGGVEAAEGIRDVEAVDAVLEDVEAAAVVVEVAVVAAAVVVNMSGAGVSMGFCFDFFLFSSLRAFFLLLFLFATFTYLG